MQTEIRNRPAFANILVALEPGDRLVAEADAMATMSATVEMSTRWSGGPMRAVLKRVFGGESLFVNEYTTATAGEIVLTQPLPGDIECIELAGTTMYLQPGAFIACDAGVKLELGYAGFKSLIAGEGLFRLKVRGQGRVWFGAYGGIFSRDIDAEYIVDSGHLIAYEPSIQINVGLAGGLINSFLSGEGVITRLKGPGKIYMQSRNFGALAAWTNSHLW